MPFRSNRELPDNVKDNLPDHAQEIYREGYNGAWDQYSDPEERRGDDTREEVAHKVVWSAVKTKYEKVGEEWQPKSE